MSDTVTTEAPIMLRADVTRDEVRLLRLIALTENKTSQALLAELIRDRIRKETT